MTLDHPLMVTCNALKIQFTFELCLGFIQRFLQMLSGTG
jgi:hypothetical protein